MTQYDICVIGAGLIGSAAAKYCAVDGARVCLVGLPEPKKEHYQNHDIFGAWYDEGRITRHLDPDPVWAHLAAESIDRYRQIEKESEIKFFSENGYLLLADETDESCIGATRKTANNLKFDYKILKTEQLKARFPFLKIPDGMIGLFEENRAGTINPRRLVEAQVKLALKHGGEWIQDVAVKVEKLENSNFRILTRKGDQIETKRIVVCAGAFLNHFPILPSPNLEIVYRTALVSRVRIDPGPLLDSLLKSMPSFKFTSKLARSEIFGENGPRKIEFEEGQGGGLAFYGLAPIQYPDGHYYLKVGYDSGTGQRCLYDNDSVIDWFRNGPEMNQAIGRQIAELTGEFVKGLDTTKFEVDTCVWLETPTERPYIGELNKNFYIVTGDNGYAAKSSDELGRLGARLALDDGKWPSDFLKQDMLQPRFKS